MQIRMRVMNQLDQLIVQIMEIMIGVRLVDAIGIGVLPFVLEVIHIHVPRFPEIEEIVNGCSVLMMIRKVVVQDQD
jgi:hypothetical protein